MSNTRMFKPMKIGNIEVKHRIGMAPLTRLRATDDRVPNALMKEYYSQRAAVPGTLLISEGNFVSANCGGYLNGPGIWKQEQIDGWKVITDEVHRKGCFIYCQIYAMGRVAEHEVAKREGFAVSAPSAIPMEEGGDVPQEMTIDDIKQTVEDFTLAAKNAVAAGFDGVEVHGAYGYLLDQFNQDVSNQRTDDYGGSIENRSRLLIEILNSVAYAITPERVGLRLSPWSPFQGMKMDDPIPQFTDIITKANQAKIAYLHLIEPRISGAEDVVVTDKSASLSFGIDLWDGPLLIAGGYKPTEAQELVDKIYPHRDIIIIFGRYFISNPDLVYKIQKGLEMSAYNRKTFYTGTPIGYVDYPFSEEYTRHTRVLSIPEMVHVDSAMPVTRGLINF